MPNEWSPRTIPLPDSVSFETAATVWHVYGTNASGQQPLSSVNAELWPLSVTRAIHRPRS
jgi:hypothetical protein